MRPTDKACLEYLRGELSLLRRQVEAEVEQPTVGKGETLADAITRYLKKPRVMQMTDYQARCRVLRDFSQVLGKHPVRKITEDAVDTLLRSRLDETVVKKGVEVPRWQPSTVRGHAMFLSGVYTELYGTKVENPVLELLRKKRLPAKGQSLDQAQPMEKVRELLEEMKALATGKRRKTDLPTLTSIRIEILGLTPLSLSEYWALSEPHVDLDRKQIRLPDFRIIEKYARVNGEWQRRPVKVPAPARTLTLSPEAVEAWRRLLTWHNPQKEHVPFTRFGYFPSSRIAATLRWASQRAGLDYHVRPIDFGTENHPDRETTLKVVTALRETKWLDGAVFRKTAFRDAYIRACVLAFTGMRVGELALVQPADISFDEKILKAPTEKKGDDGRRKVARRRIPLGSEALAAFQMFYEYQLFGGWEGVSGAPDQIPPDSEITWYNTLYRAVRLAATRVVDSVTGEPIHAHPHVLRHSFATAIVNERDGSGKKADLRTAQHILGHASLTTTARYVRPSEETARQAIEYISSTATTLPSLEETDVPVQPGLRLVSKQ